MVLALKGLRSDLGFVWDQISASPTVPSLKDVSARLLRIFSQPVDTSGAETSVEYEFASLEWLSKRVR